MRPCLDVLAAAKYPDVILKHVPRHIGLGVFASTFGEALPFVEKAIQKGFVYFRIQLTWDGSHKYGDSFIPEIKKYSKRYEALKQKYPHVTIDISPCCETRHPNPDKYCDIVAKLAPSCGVVNTTLNVISRKYRNEVHGTKPKALKTPYLFSYDGNSVNSVNYFAMKDKHAGAEAFFLWAAILNLKASDTDATPINKRTLRPHKADIQWLLSFFDRDE